MTWAPALGVGVEHVGVVDHDEGRRSVQPQFLAQLSKLVRGLAALEVIPSPVLAKILEPDPAVGADHARSDPAGP